MQLFSEIMYIAQYIENALHEQQEYYCLSTMSSLFGQQEHSFLPLARHHTVSSK